MCISNNEIAVCNLRYNLRAYLMRKLPYEAA
jgi:hypothetical protein